jgi:hypothetical protein
MKKLAAVAAAERALAAKKAELAAAEATIACLRFEVADAHRAVFDAQSDADAALPQCRMVAIGWRGSPERDVGRTVILRRTPTGILVVRSVGFTDRGVFKFKWNERTGRFVQAEKRTLLCGDTRELRDVPEQFLPATGQGVEA